MGRYLAGYAVALVVVLALDMLWIGVIAKPLYAQGIGHLMAERPNLAAAAAFYLVYPVGLLAFAVLPGGAPVEWGRTLASAALFGFIAYATYDLTNLATLRDWPVGLALLDMAWGTGISVAAASAAKAVLARLYSA
jgi:uncharacterized membrane protein